MDLAALDRVGVAALHRALEPAELIVIDEIGKMELHSIAFREAVLRAMAGERKVLATIMLAHHPFADDLKAQGRLLVVTRENRPRLVQTVTDWLQGGKA